MKSTLTFLAIALACQTASADVFTAVVQVESGSNRNAVGDNGQARGYVQCHRGAWADGCEALGVDWDYATGTRDLAKCRRVFFAYTSRYGAKSDRDRCRAWHCGPTWRKYKDLEYWAKVRKEMKRG